MDWILSILLVVVAVCLLIMAKRQSRKNRKKSPSQDVPSLLETVLSFSATEAEEIKIREAREALVTIGTPAVEPLVNAINNEDLVGSDKCLLISVLGQIGTPAVEPLIAMLERAHTVHQTESNVEVRLD